MLDERLEFILDMVLGNGSLTKPMLDMILEEDSLTKVFGHGTRKWLINQANAGHDTRK